MLGCRLHARAAEDAGACLRQHRRWGGDSSWHRLLTPQPCTASTGVAEGVQTKLRRPPLRPASHGPSMYTGIFGLFLASGYETRLRCGIVRRCGTQLVHRVQQVRVVAACGDKVSG